MDRYVTVGEMRALEVNADYFGVSFGDLMENAGKAVADAIVARYPPCRARVVCGKGNNGGDGFVVARLLALKGYTVSVMLLGRSAEVKKGPASENLYKLRFTHIDAMEIEDAAMIPADIFQTCDLIVDAILGTGSRGPPRGLERRAIDLINGSRAAKVSVAVPSGLYCYTGVCSGCVLPYLVVTFHAPKKGLEMYNYIAADIGIPGKASLYVGPGDLMNIRTRGDCAHKGECGRVLVVGGGPYTGAPALVAMAALRAGAGWVTVAAPQRAADIVATFSPDLITVPLVDRHKIVMADIDRVAPLIKKHDVVVIGNGAGQDMESLAAISEIIKLCEKVVIDADALRPDMPLHGIITPHPGEFSRISGFEAANSDLRQAVMKFSADHGVVTVLKSKTNIISDGERVRLNGTGNPGMAVGGTGDVLAGITGAFYCRNGAFEAAASAAFAGGAAGDMAYEDKSYWLTATDMIRQIPYVLKKYRLR